MQILLINSILTYIAAKYPGSISQFIKDGGNLTAIPSPSNDLIITHPNLPPDIKKDFEKLKRDNIGQPLPHPILQKDMNFGELETPEKKKILNKLVSVLEKIDSTITIGDTPGALIIYAPNIKKEKSDTQESLLEKQSKNTKAFQLREALMYTYKLSYAYILWKNGIEVYKKSDTTSVTDIEPLNDKEKKEVQNQINKLLKEIEDKNEN